MVRRLFWAFRKRAGPESALGPFRSQSWHKGCSIAGVKITMRELIDRLIMWLSLLVFAGVEVAFVYALYKVLGVI